MRARLALLGLLLAAGCRDYDGLEVDLAGVDAAADGASGADGMIDAGPPLVDDLMCASTALHFDGGFDAAGAIAEAIGDEATLTLHGDGTAGAATAAVTQLAMGDVTGDGVVDLVALGADPTVSDDELTLLPGVIAGGRVTFTPTELVRRPSLASVFAIGDLDGKGPFEIVLGTDMLYDLDDSITIARWNGGSLAPMATLPAPTRPRSFAIGDLDRDGAIDLVVGFNAYLGDGSAPPPGLLRIYWGVPDGVPGGTDFTDVTGLPPDPSFIAIADLDGDCLAELVVAHRSGATGANFAVVSHDARRAFTRDLDEPIIVPSDIVGLSAADLDRDGRDDLVVSSYSADTGLRSLRALYARARGPEGRFEVVELAQDQDGAATIGDLDRDGLPDVVYWNLLGELHGALARPDRTFAAATLSTSAGAAPVGAPLALAGNANGRLDLYYFAGFLPTVAFRLGL